MRADPDLRRHKAGRYETRRPRGGFWRAVRRLILIFALLPVPVILLYRVVPPPLTPLMVMRHVAEGEPIRKEWVPFSRISPSLARAVVASEDEKFCIHHGFDWAAYGEAWRQFRTGHRPRGASTISMQTAKNLFLWPGRSLIRKGLEAYLTVWLELLWPKQRIIEVYLNVIEWGHGIYGAEAASRAYFGRPASALTAEEAARLAAVLPNPRQFSAARSDGYIAERTATILDRMPHVAVPGPRGCH